MIVTAPMTDPGFPCPWCNVRPDVACKHRPAVKRHQVELAEDQRHKPRDGYNKRYEVRKDGKIKRVENVHHVRTKRGPIVDATLLQGEVREYLRTHPEVSQSGMGRKSMNDSKLIPLLLAGKRSMTASGQAKLRQWMRDNP